MRWLLACSCLLTSLFVGAASAAQVPEQAPKAGAPLAAPVAPASLQFVAEHPVEGIEYDLRDGRRVGDLKLDDGFGGVHHEAGRAEHSLTAPDGRSVTLWGDESFGFVQAFTNRSFSALPSGSVAVAVEPMTAPANALNSGQALQWLSPGETFKARWGISPHLAPA